jgi:hypothetical protein
MALAFMTATSMNTLLIARLWWGTSPLKVTSSPSL